MQGTENQKIRAAVIRARVEYRQIAEALGMKPTSLSRLLSKPLGQAREAEILLKRADMIKPTKKSRLEALLFVKDMSKSRACKILHVDRAELDRVIGAQEPELRELEDHFCEVLSFE